MAVELRLRERVLMTSWRLPTGSPRVHPVLECPDAAFLPCQRFSTAPLNCHRVTCRSTDERLRAILGNDSKQLSEKPLAQRFDELLSSHKSALHLLRDLQQNFLLVRGERRLACAALQSHELPRRRCVASAKGHLRRAAVAELDAVSGPQRIHND
jgi:hypothetical protein